MNQFQAKRVLIIGPKGQVGSALLELARRDEFAGLFSIGSMGRPEIDLADEGVLARALDEVSADIVINAAAYTAVDKAESERELAFRINAVAPGLIAEHCAENNAFFVHYSTDYVFPGTDRAPWKEEDLIEPLNYYGATKAEGDARVVASGCRGVILRTSWVYDWKGRNFLTTMLRLARERSEIKVVDDQIGAPTFAIDLASATMRIIAAASGRTGSENGNKAPCGVYHCCNSGETSWFGFASEIFRLALEAGVLEKKPQLTAIRSSEYPTNAKRPFNSRLDCSRLLREQGIEMRGWLPALRECMKRLNT